MKKFYLIFSTLLLVLALNNNLKAQDVLLPEGPFKNFVISTYPSGFVNVDGNGRRLLDSTCVYIRTVDS